MAQIKLNQTFYRCKNCGHISGSFIKCENCNADNTFLVQQIKCQTTKEMFDAGTLCHSCIICQEKKTKKSEIPDMIAAYFLG